MMTEEKKQALIKHNIAKINSITPQFMKEVLPGVKRHLQCEIDSAKLALDSLRTALTQPASPALKLPDAKPEHDSEDGNDVDYLEPSQVYALGVDDGLNRCLREVVKLNAPHTATIEPICATGGAEWVKCSERMPEIGSTILVHMQDPIHSATPYAVATYDKYGFSRSKVTHWMPLPAAPEEE